MASRGSLSRVLLPADGVAALDAATKQMVDTNPTTVRGATDYDDTAGPTDRQAILWVASGSKFKPQTIQLADVSGLVSGLAGKQPLDTDLTTIAGLTATTDSVMQAKSGAWAARTLAQLKTDLALQPLDSDLTTIAGLTATTDSFLQSKASAWTTRTIAQVKTDLAVNLVDNTSDAGKPVSTAQQAALDNKAGGIVGGRTITGLNNLGSAIGGVAAMPTNMNSGAVALAANRRFLIHVRFKCQGSNNNEDFLLRVFEGTAAWTSGAPGNQIRQHVYRTVANTLGYTNDIFADYETSGAVTRWFSLTAILINGTGTAQFMGGDTGSTNLVGVFVYDNGPAGKLTVTAS
jgi:hypothetical protein